eukprot:PhF_6_TR1943/c0_g1_i1/m.3083
MNHIPATPPSGTRWGKIIQTRVNRLRQQLHQQELQPESLVATPPFPDIALSSTNTARPPSPGDDDPKPQIPAESIGLRDTRTCLGGTIPHGGRTHPCPPSRQTLVYAHPTTSTAECPQCHQHFPYIRDDVYNTQLKFETHVFECRVAHKVDPTLPLVTIRRLEKGEIEATKNKHIVCQARTTEWVTLPTVQNNDEIIARVQAATLQRMRARTSSNKHRQPRKSHERATECFLNKLHVPEVVRESNTGGEVTRYGKHNVSVEAHIPTPPVAPHTAAMVQSTSHCLSSFGDEEVFQVTESDLEPECVVMLAQILQHHPNVKIVDFSKVALPSHDKHCYELLLRALKRNKRITTFLRNERDEKQKYLESVVMDRRGPEDEARKARQHFNTIVSAHLEAKALFSQSVAALENKETQQRMQTLHLESQDRKDIHQLYSRAHFKMQQQLHRETWRVMCRHQQEDFVEDAEALKHTVLMEFFGHVAFHWMKLETVLRGHIEAQRNADLEVITVLRKKDRMKSTELTTQRTKAELQIRKKFVAECEASRQVEIDAFYKELDEVRSWRSRVIAFYAKQVSTNKEMVDTETQRRSTLRNEEATAWSTLMDRVAQNLERMRTELMKVRQQMLHQATLGSQAIFDDAILIAELRKQLFESELTFLRVATDIRKTEYKRRALVRSLPVIEFTNTFPIDRKRPPAYLSIADERFDPSPPVNVFDVMSFRAKLTDAWTREYTSVSILAKDNQQRELNAFDVHKQALAQILAKLSEVSRRHGETTSSKIQCVCQVDLVPIAQLIAYKEIMRGVTLTLSLRYDDDDPVTEGLRGKEVLAYEKFVSTNGVLELVVDPPTEENMLTTLSNVQYYCCGVTLPEPVIRTVTLDITIKYLTQDTILNTQVPANATPMTTSLKVLVSVMVYSPFATVSSRDDVREYHEGMTADEMPLLPPSFTIVDPPQAKRNLSMDEGPQFSPRYRLEKKQPTSTVASAEVMLMSLTLSSASQTSSNAKQRLGTISNLKSNSSLNASMTFPVEDSGVAPFSKAVIEISFLQGYTQPDQILFRDGDGVKAEVDKFDKTVRSISLGGSPFMIVERGFMQTVKAPGDPKPNNDTYVFRIVAPPKFATVEYVRLVLSRLRFANLALDAVEGERILRVVITDQNDLASSFTVRFEVHVEDNPTEVVVPHRRIVYFNNYSSVPSSIGCEQYIRNVFVPIAREATVTDVDTLYFYGGWIKCTITNPMPGDAVVMLSYWDNDAGEEEQNQQQDTETLACDIATKDITLGGSLIGRLVEGCVGVSPSALELSGTTLHLQFTTMTIPQAQTLLRLLAFSNTLNNGKAKEVVRNVALEIAFGPTVPNHTNPPPTDLKIEGMTSVNIQVRVAEPLCVINDKSNVLEYKDLS